MALTFQQGSTLIVRSPTASREFLAGSITASQTFLEQSREVKTLHNPNTLSQVFTTSKANTSVSFDVYIGNVLDGILFEWAGFLAVDSTKFLISPSGAQAVPYTLDIKSNGTTYSISNVYLENISISMSKSGPLMLSITASGGNLVVGTTAASAGSIQTSEEFTIGSIDNIDKLAGFTCEITRALQWINQNSIHSVLQGSIYTNEIAVCESLSIAGSISIYKTSDAQITNLQNQTIEFVYNNRFRGYFDSCNVLTRYDLSSVHRHISDYKVQSDTLSSYFEFI